MPQPQRKTELSDLEKADCKTGKMLGGIALKPPGFGSGKRRRFVFADRACSYHVMSRIDFGIYTFYGSINSQLASDETGTGFSDEDAEKLKQALCSMFENDASSARPDGSMEVLKVIWWRHSSPSGDISSAKVHGTLAENIDSNGLIIDEKKLTLSFTKDQGTSDLKPKLLDGF